DTGWGSSDDATATGTSTTGTDSSSSDSSDDCLFLCDFDLPPDPTPCDPFAQNCPVGEKCMALGEGPGGPWFTTVCSPIIGEGLLDDPCTINAPEAVDDCAAGLFCWQGQCTSFCKGSLEDPLCAGSSSCEFFDDVLPLCLNQCDPLAQDCGPDMGCWWTGIDFSCANTSLDIPTGDPCGFINDCVVGDVCLVAELFPDCAGDNCCASFCSLSDANACAGQPGLSCVSFFEMGEAPPGFEDLGVCVLG
ncbi:MAG: ribulose phosphate epimerase, partial [Myxococcales bacterium]|nr:ribulose phosphate epimerase [Myxococcales bacterium]